MYFYLCNLSCTASRINFIIIQLSSFGPTIIQKVFYKPLEGSQLGKVGHISQLETMAPISSGLPMSSLCFISPVKYQTGRGPSQTNDRIGPPDPSRESIIFLSCFLLYNLSGVSRFLLLFAFFRSEIFKISLFPLHSRALFFFFFSFALLSTVCVGGRSVGPPPTHTHHTHCRNIFSVTNFTILQSNFYIFN